MHANVSATFDRLAAAESTISSLIAARFPSEAVSLTHGTHPGTYVVTVDAGGRLGEAEDVVRQAQPVHWTTSILDGHEASHNPLLHVAPEADSLEQAEPWLAGTGQPAGAVDGWPEADWIEQAQAAYRTGEDLTAAASHATAVPEADYEEQATSAYREPLDLDER